ncbi:MAG: exodeoxyribonuclease VII large subunit [Bacilli bacterium]|nr:exodeoxyribonuclease VII large subunit [Bacilli bacterium]
MNNNYITVTQLTKYIKYKIDNDQNLMKIYLKGEISNFKAHSRGHMYFTIKDENTRINAIMFSTYASKLKFMPIDGMKVLISGKVSVYEQTGSYQIYVDSLEEDGLGNLYVAFEQLKKKLEQEGLFDQSKKKPIPKMPSKIGIITAPTGAAIKDILSTLKRRWPIAETILFPSLVQGAEAATDIVRNIELSKNYDLDVLIVGRGGGSIEDMWCFNEEIVARAIYDLDVPVISAVGHEIDFTISDFVADLRAPTPTGAAEMAVPNINDVINYLKQLEIRTINSITNIIKINKEALNKITENYILKNPITMYQIKEEKFDNLFDRLINSYKKIISDNKNKLVLITNNLNNGIINNLNNNKNRYLTTISKLEVLNPLNTIKRGYSITKKEGKVITSTKDVKRNDNLQLELSDGTIDVEVL